MFAVAMSMLLMIACSKEVNEIETPENISGSQTINGISLIEYNSPFARGGSQSSLLAFTDLATFKSTIAQLETDFEAHDDAFIAQWPSLTADQLSDKEQVVGFDSYQPLKNFESLYLFSNSMRKDYEIAENNWLNNSDLIESNDPDKTFYELDVEEMTVLNDVGAVKIGTAIYKVFDGGYIEIPSGNTDFLNRVAYYDPITDGDIGDEDIIIYNNDNSNGNPPTSYCFYDGDNRSSWTTATRRKMKGTVKVVNNWLWGVKIKSKTKYYKKAGGI